MIISRSFNRFYFGVIVKQLKEADVLFCANLNFRFKPRQVRIKSFYHLLKALDLGYPNCKNKKMSLTKINNKQLLAHIEFCFKLAADSGYKMPYVEEQWELLKKEGVS